MATAYVDTSVVIAIAFGEAGADTLARRMNAFGERLAANLLEAEFRSAHAREGRAPDLSLLASLTWVTPSRPLSDEIGRVLEAGRVRGADCWHLATALYLDPAANSLTFLTLDNRQKVAAKALGFRT